MGRKGMLGLCSFGSPYSLGGCRTLHLSLLKVDLVGFLQCKQFVVTFALQWGCWFSFKYFVGLFVVVKKGVRFVVVVCLVQQLDSR